MALLSVVDSFSFLTKLVSLEIKKIIPMTAHSRVASALLTHGTGKETHTHRKIDQSKTKVELYVQYKGLKQPYLVLGRVPSR